MWFGSRTTSPQVQVSASAVGDGLGGLCLRVGGVVGKVWFGSRTTSSPEPRQVLSTKGPGQCQCYQRWVRWIESSPMGCTPVSVLSEVGLVEFFV